MASGDDVIRRTGVAGHGSQLVPEPRGSRKDLSGRFPPVPPLAGPVQPDERRVSRHQARSGTSRGPGTNRASGPLWAFPARTVSARGAPRLCGFRFRPRPRLRTGPERGRRGLRSANLARSNAAHPRPDAGGRFVRRSRAGNPWSRKSFRDAHVLIAVPAIRRNPVSVPRRSSPLRGRVPVPSASGRRPVVRATPPTPREPV